MMEIHAKVTEGVGRERHVISDGLADGGHVLAVDAGTFVCELVARWTYVQALVVLDAALVCRLNNLPKR
jgi:hypothetical protein